MGVGPQQRSSREYRGQMPSPGRPTVAWREDRVRFWAAIAKGRRYEEAAAEGGVSPAVGTRWFRHAGPGEPHAPGYLRSTGSSRTGTPRAPGTSA